MPGREPLGQQRDHLALTRGQRPSRGRDGDAIQPTTTELGNGRVLVVGGTGPAPQNDALDLVSLFDGGAVTSVNLQKPLVSHTATRLADGSVLVAGGLHSTIPGTPYSTDVLRFDANGDLVAPSPPALAISRAGHTATLLADGATVLIAGGAELSAELYDPASGPTLLASPIPEHIGYHTALLLPGSGEVLITGGGVPDGVSAAAVLYDPVAKAFSTPTAHARSWHTATLLPGGDLLLTGGLYRDDTEATNTADRFDPRTRTFTSIGDPKVGAMAQARLAHTATLLPDGRVVVAGGQDGQGAGATTLSSIETWNGSAFEDGGSLVTGRAFHTATLLTDGTVLLAGGAHSTQLLASAEIIDPHNGKPSVTTGAMSHARYRHAAVRLPSGRVLIAGGITLDKDHPYDGLPVATAEIYDPVAHAFTDVAGSAPVLRDTRAMVLPSGEVLIVGDQIVYRFDESTSELSVAGSAPDRAFGAAMLPGGRLLLCGVNRCDTGTEAGLGTAAVLDGAQRDGHTLTALPGGELFALGFTPAHAQHTFSYRAFPPGAPRPVITHAPEHLMIGASATLTGERFQHLSARGTTPALLAQPQILPRVIFVPSASGAPVTAALQNWSDGAITFTAPRTPYLGGGWLVVIVDGVASEGAWADLAAADQGIACGFDAECTSGHCAEGVCCDQACNDGCRSCLASLKSAGADGTCGPLAAQGEPRIGCTCTSSFDCVDGQVCFPDGRCDVPGSPSADGPGCSAARGAKDGGEVAAVITLLALLAARRRRDQKV